MASEIAERARTARPSKQAGARSRLADVARHAGVSTMTVARVLRQPEKVAPKTRARVTQSLAATQYVPDLLARALASRHTGVVAAIVPTLANSLIAEVTQGMSEALARHGRQLMIGASNYSAVTEEALVRSFLARRVDAIYLTGTSQTPATVKMLRASGIPVVQGGNLPARAIDLAVGISNAASARRMTEVLIATYGTALGYVGGPVGDNDRMRDRRLGFLAAMKAAGARLRSDLMFEAPISMRAGREVARAVVALHQRPRALFCGSDVIAAGVVFELVRQGVRVPADIAVAGYDDLDFASEMVPSLTSVRVPRFEIGLRAAELITGALAGERPAKRNVDMGYDVIRRESA